MARDDEGGCGPPRAVVAELADRLPVGLFLTDAEGRCTYVNQRWCELSGVTAAHAMDRGWVDARAPRRPRGGPSRLAAVRGR